MAAVQEEHIASGRTQEEHRGGVEAKLIRKTWEHVSRRHYRPALHNYTHRRCSLLSLASLLRSFKSGTKVGWDDRMSVASAVPRECAVCSDTYLVRNSPRYGSVSTLTDERDLALEVRIPLTEQSVNSVCVSDYRFRHPFAMMSKGQYAFSAFLLVDIKSVETTHDI